MGCATGLVKFLLFLFNFVVVVGGVALVVFGVLFYNGYKEYETILPDLGPYQFPPILMIVVGAVIFFIAFMGCCGIIRESKCMMITYAVFLLILLVAEIAIAVGIATHQDQMKSALEEGMLKSIDEFRTNTEVQNVWNAMQDNLKCCGARNWQDWSGAGISTPGSCCGNPVGDQGCSGRVSDGLALIKIGEIYPTGCADKIFEKLKTEYGMYAAAVLALVEFLGVILGCCLGARFGRKLYHT